MVSEQWFVDVKEAADASFEAIDSNKINIVPQRFKKTFYQWL
jgi:valyl-tRNA synthetase